MFDDEFMNDMLLNPDLYDLEDEDNLDLEKENYDSEEDEL